MSHVPNILICYDMNLIKNIIENVFRENNYLEEMIYPWYSYLYSSHYPHIYHCFLASSFHIHDSQIARLVANQKYLGSSKLKGYIVANQKYQGSSKL